MLSNDLLDLNQVILVFQTPIAILMIKTFVLSLMLNYVIKIFFVRNSLVVITLIALSIITLFYFGVLQTFTLITLILGCLFFGYKILKLNNFLISLFVSLLIFIQFFILISLSFNVNVAYYLLFIVSFALLLYKREDNIKILVTLYNIISDYLKRFNILDFWLITLSFILGSLPQSHWDAVQANLYNAKRFVINNSLSPLIESISSLFPQNAEVYYALFYKIGGLKMLQIAYILPLIILILLIKDILKKVHYSHLFNYAVYLFLLTPIIIFESSNGYYDLLVLLTVFIPVYIILFQEKKNILRNTLIASFVIGFGAATKYFPIILILLPIFYYFIYNKKGLANILLTTTACLFFGILPLAIWLIRAYLYTGSPIFPFFQSIFPTPEFWQGSELSNNFMIQTTMNISVWLKGGFLLYPILTFFNTEKFVEGTITYPGFGYILLLPIQILILIISLKNIIANKFKRSDIVYLYLFFSFIIIGVLSRYYRYLWPFQFSLAVVSILYLEAKTINKGIVRTMVNGVILFSLIININSIIIYYRFFQIFPERYFHPDYFITKKNEKDPTLFLNLINIDENKVILDMSKDAEPRFQISRFHLLGKTYKCNWYWINMNNVISESLEDNIIIKEFDYIITSNPIEESVDACLPILESTMNSARELYRDDLYIIYEIIKT